MLIALPIQSIMLCTWKKAEYILLLIPIPIQCIMLCTWQKCWIYTAVDSSSYPVPHCVCMTEMLNIYWCWFLFLSSASLCVHERKVDCILLLMTLPMQCLIVCRWQKCWIYTTVDTSSYLVPHIVHMKDRLNIYCCWFFYLSSASYCAYERQVEYILLFVPLPIQCLKTGLPKATRISKGNGLSNIVTCIVTSM